ncbi:hypothetical protein [Fodinicola feengrottensis]|uniref:hypothetical protein n=1 Tax=Fodinicola feengrottensis TaxID=435914 RepID=UPI0024419331|nr:hypothetical protein [Fodinicola feengrottensis]
MTPYVDHARPPRDRPVAHRGGGDAQVPGRRILRFGRDFQRALVQPGALRPVPATLGEKSEVEPEPGRFRVQLDELQQMPLGRGRAASPAADASR